MPRPLKLPKENGAPGAAFIVGGCQLFLQMLFVIILIQQLENIAGLYLLKSMAWAA